MYSNKENISFTAVYVFRFNLAMIYLQNNMDFSSMDVLSRCLQAPIPNLGQNKPNFLVPGAEQSPPPGEQQQPSEQQPGPAVPSQQVAAPVAPQQVAAPGGETAQPIMYAQGQQPGMMPPGGFPGQPIISGVNPQQFPQQVPQQGPGEDDFADFQQAPAADGFQQAHTPMGPPPKSGKLQKPCVCKLAYL